MRRSLTIFGAVLARHPVKGGAIAWWWLTRRRLRAASRLRAAAASLPDVYGTWLSLHDPARQADDDAAHGPLIAVHLHLPPDHDVATANAAMRSVVSQTYANWVLHITSAQGSTGPNLDDPRIRVSTTAFATRAGAIAAVLEETPASHLVPLDWDAALTRGALPGYARALSIALADDPHVVAVLYADQDERRLRGRRRSNPWFKPEWDADLFLAQDYLSAACAIPVEPARRLAIDLEGPDEGAVTALLVPLTLGEDAVPARHVPCMAVTTPEGRWRQANPARREQIRRILAGNVDLDVCDGPFGTLAIRRSLPDPVPGVSVIVPTRDRMDLLETCVEGVLHGTDYPAIELIIADNGSIEPETLAYFERCARDPRVKVVPWPHPYNYSAVNNFAIGHASQPYICLLNNDTEVIDAAWLREMMVQAVRPEVGAVGARLLYPDHSIQHAGVVVGMGGAAGHAHRGLPEGEPGYFAQALVAREATAVTAACLVVARDKFDAVGGLDEAGLAIAYNDVDLCLKLRAAGWRNLYVPQAVMIHHESKSRGLDFAPEHLARYMRELSVFQQRWATVGFQDPTHHPALDPASEIYRLKL